MDPADDDQDREPWRDRLPSILVAGVPLLLAAISITALVADERYYSASPEFLLILFGVNATASAASGGVGGLFGPGDFAYRASLGFVYMIGAVMVYGFGILAFLVGLATV